MSPNETIDFFFPPVLLFYPELFDREQYNEQPATPSWILFLGNLCVALVENSPCLRRNVCVHSLVFSLCACWTTCPRAITLVQLSLLIWVGTGVSSLQIRAVRTDLWGFLAAKEVMLRFCLIAVKERMKEAWLMKFGNNQCSIQKKKGFYIILISNF